MTDRFDMVDVALDALPSRYDKDNFVQAFASAFGEAGQLVEDAAHDLIVNSRIPNATGQYLDDWGQVVDEQRNDLIDNEYRKIILGKIASNRSYGRPEGVEQSIENLFNANDWNVHRYPPASARVVVFDEFPYSDQFIDRATELLESAFPAGIEVFLRIASNTDPLQLDQPAPRSLDTGEFV
jgi:hypothetical protein